jgi:hypothetical protein
VLSETKVMRDIHSVREKMSADLRPLSPTERAEKTNREATEIAERYGVKVIEKAPQRISVQ